MSISTFLQEYDTKDKEEQWFDFRLNCLDQYFKNQARLSLSLDDHMNLEKIKEIILNNLYCNIGSDRCFYQNMIRSVYDLLKTTQVSSDLVAVHFLLLHYSKTNFQALDDYNMTRDYMQHFLQFKTVEPPAYTKNQEILFNKLITHPGVKKLIDQAVFEVTKEKNSYDIAHTQLKWFELQAATGLAGFSSPDTIYFNDVSFNITLCHCLNSNIKKHVSSSDAVDSQTVLRQLKFIAVVLHELAHIALRKTINNLNEINDSELDVGCIAERLLFDGKLVDWDKSASDLEVNTVYCAQFVENLTSSDSDSLPVSFYFIFIFLIGSATYLMLIFSCSISKLAR